MECNTVWVYVLRFHASKISCIHSFTLVVTQPSFWWGSEPTNTIDIPRYKTELCNSWITFKKQPMQLYVLIRGDHEKLMHNIIALTPILIYAYLHYSLNSSINGFLSVHCWWSCQMNPTRNDMILVKVALQHQLLAEWCIMHMKNTALDKVLMMR